MFLRINIAEIEEEEEEEEREMYIFIFLPKRRCVSQYVEICSPVNGLQESEHEREKGAGPAVDAVDHRQGVAVDLQLRDGRGVLQAGQQYLLSVHFGKQSVLCPTGKDFQYF